MRLMTDHAPSSRAPLSVGLKTACAWLLVAALAPVAAQTAPLVSAAPTDATAAASPVTDAPPSQTLVNVQAQPVEPASRAWKELTPLQKQALAPLGAQWSALSGQQQKKWLALSQNFNQLSVPEQITMHSRMSDWVSLSPQQRNLARLNFNKLQSLPKEDKKAKWEAYQALSPEEKRLLSAASMPPAKSAALTAKPLPPHRVVETPVRALAEKRPPSPEINRKTLLPRAPAVATPAPVESVPSTDASRLATETAPS
jgi:Protein of unknown function (DUF3106)